MITKLAPLSFAAIILNACSWGTQGLKSKWEVLSQAKTMGCYDIPVGLGDLRIDRVHVVPSLGPSLILEARTRKGLKSFYHLAFSDVSSMNESALTTLPVDQDSLFLGAGIWSEKAVFAVRATVRGNQVIQLRDLQNNAILRQFPINVNSDWEVASWLFAENKLRLLVREEKLDESIDDQPYKQVEVNLSEPKESNPSFRATQSIIGDAHLFLGDSSNPQIIWLDRGTSAGVKESTFHLGDWRQPDKAAKIGISGKYGIESWTFLDGTETNFLAYISGDTLLWNNASAEVVRLDRVSPLKPRSHLTLPLSKVHVAQPLLASGIKGEYLFIPQWLDHELTIGSYKISSEEIELVGYRGLFKEGSSFQRVFFHEPSKEFLLLMRVAGSWISQHSICRLKI